MKKTISLIGICLILSALFLMQTAVARPTTRVDVTFALYFIDQYPCAHVDAVHGGGRVVELSWEGTGGALSGDIGGTIGAWTESDTMFYSQPYDPDHTDLYLKSRNMVAVFTILSPATVNGIAGSGRLTIELTVRCVYAGGSVTRQGTWTIVDATGSLEGAQGYGKYIGVSTDSLEFTGKIVLH